MIAWLVMSGTVAGATMSRLWNPTYQWSAELVRVDRDAGTLTVRSWILGPDDVLTRVADLVPGERIVVAWSGAFDHASGIRYVVRQDPGAAVSGRFQMPAEFVAATTDGPRRHVTFTVRVPDEMLEGVAELEPGVWITATARHRPLDEAALIVAVRPRAIGSLYAVSRPSDGRSAESWV